MNNFDKWLKCYKNDELSIFSQDTEALLWLKLKTIVRKKWLNAFVQQHQLHLTTFTLQDQCARMVVTHGDAGVSILHSRAGA